MIALVLAQNGIRANAICPGSIQTQIGESTHKRGIEEIRELVRLDFYA
jgi:NAD(P)-dependent dehydrogenase (short-subunit alcohol dehydrogenase family)